MSSYVELDPACANKLLAVLLGDRASEARVEITEAGETQLKCKHPVLAGLLKFSGAVKLEAERKSERRFALLLQPANTTTRVARCLWKMGRSVKGLFSAPQPVHFAPGVELTPDALTVDLDEVNEADLPPFAQILVDRLEITEFAIPGSEGNALTLGFKLKE